MAFESLSERLSMALRRVNTNPSLISRTCLPDRQAKSRTGPLPLTFLMMARSIMIPWAWWQWI